jgi:ribosomal protein S18 acetylase RimI-like enzyme
MTTERIPGETGPEAAPGELDTDVVLVRTLRAGDLEPIARIDEKISGRSRRKYFEVKIASVLQDTGVKISLVAEIDGIVAGFLMGAVYYGEFGLPEATATIDTIGVHPDFRGRKIGKALMRQLVMNLRALGIERIETQVAWDDWDLLGFLKSERFEPAPRLCLHRRL